MDSLNAAFGENGLANTTYGSHMIAQLTESLIGQFGSEPMKKQYGLLDSYTIGLYQYDTMSNGKTKLENINEVQL